MDMSYALFNGVSLQLRDTAASDAVLSKLKRMPGVTGLWPIVTMTGPGSDSPDIVANKPTKRDAAPSASALAESDSDKKAAAYNPHVMTQVDKLHARGVTGKGSKIAIIDTGVSRSLYPRASTLKTHSNMHQ